MARRLPGAERPRQRHVLNAVGYAGTASAASWENRQLNPEAESSAGTGQPLDRWKLSELHRRLFRDGAGHF